MSSNNNFEQILALDLQPIKTKLMHAESGEGWSQQKADAVEVQYKRFLCLMQKYPEQQMAPLVDVDIFWHYHILDTMKYAVDCEAIFGYFLHHYPYLGMGDDADEGAREEGANLMATLYEETFSESYLAAARQITQVGAEFCATRTLASTAANDASGFCAAPARPQASMIAASPAFCAAPANPAVDTAAASAAFCAAPAKPAFCAAPAKPAVGAAFCAAPSKPAFCADPAKSAAASAVDAAFCAAPAKPAFCAAPAVELAASAAFCAAPAKPAFCAAPAKPVTARTAFCAAPAKPAFCAAPAKPATASAAFCAAPAKPAFCAAPSKPAFCAAPSKPAAASAAFCAAPALPQGAVGIAKPKDAGRAANADSTAMCA